MTIGETFYYDMILYNSGDIPIPFEINDQRFSSFIDTPKDWQVSVVRFNLSSDLIPLFFPVIPDPLFPLRTDMSITLLYLGNYFREYVNVTAQEVKEGVFDYTTYLNQINLASTLAFNALKAAFPAADGTSPPLFYLNEESSLISCYVQDFYLNTNVNRIQVGFNQALQDILDLPIINRFQVPDPFGFDFELSVNNSADLLPVVPRAGYPFALSIIAGNLLQVAQEFRSLDEWSTIRSIVFTSDLPIVKEYVPTRVGQSQNNNVNSSSKPILTDFLLGKDSVEPSRHTLVYIPTAEYRMISMQGTNSISSISLKGYFNTYDGISRDVYIASKKTGTLKLLFRRIN